MSALRKFAMAAAVSGAAALTMAGGALASTVEATLSSIGDELSVNITSPVNTGANAGSFNMTDGTGSIVGDFVAFCVDVFNTVSKETRYTYEIGTSPFAGDSAIISRVQRLFDAKYGEEDTNNGIFQVALWNVLYGENFAYSGLNQSSVDAVNAYLEAADEYDEGRKWNLTWLINGKVSGGEGPVQDLVAVAPVPLPAAGFLLLGGLAGLGIAARRRKSAQA